VRWSRKLPEPVRLRYGRELITLSDARALILGLAESRQAPDLALATELLLQAMVLGAGWGHTRILSFAAFSFCRSRKSGCHAWASAASIRR